MIKLMGILIGELLHVTVDHKLVLGSICARSHLENEKFWERSKIYPSITQSSLFLSEVERKPSTVCFHRTQIWARVCSRCNDSALHLSPSCMALSGMNGLLMVSSLEDSSEKLVKKKKHLDFLGNWRESTNLSMQSWKVCRSSLRVTGSRSFMHVAFGSLRT